VHGPHPPAWHWERTARQFAARDTAVLVDDIDEAAASGTVEQIVESVGRATSAVVDVICFLAGDGGSCVTGAVSVVDGRYTAV